jgi:hypothetical protein
MKRAFHSVVLATLAVPVLVLGQAHDVNKVLSDVRAALGGDNLEAVRTMAVEGTSTRVVSEGESRSSNFEMAFELPDKFVTTNVIGNLNGQDIRRTTGFNGDDLIERTDMPPNMGHGVHMIRLGRPGGAAGGELTPEQEAAQRASLVERNRAEFARFALGMFGSGLPAHPLEFAYAGVAESPDGAAHVLDVSGEGEFAVRLFVDSETHLPLMLSWMAPEPLIVTAGGGPGGMQVMTRTLTGGDPDAAREDAERQFREAEANRRTVEYRLFYADYKEFAGVLVPTRLQRMIDGNPTEELLFDKVEVNTDLDPKTFEGR